MNPSPLAARGNAHVQQIYVSDRICYHPTGMIVPGILYRLKRNTICVMCLALCISTSRPLTEKPLPFPLTAYQLDNGLQVILSEDLSLPLVTVAVGYGVGSLDDYTGKSGLAYLMESLMFSGSANVGRMQHFSFIQRIGGRLNALTERDLTVYYQTVPSNHLASVLWMESDRMLSLALNTANIERAKNSLIEELNNRKFTNPYWEGEQLFDRLAFPDVSHHRPLRGRAEELREITTEDVRKFYDTYYRPNNAVICSVYVVVPRFGDRNDWKVFLEQPCPIPQGIITANRDEDIDFEVF